MKTNSRQHLRTLMNGERVLEVAPVTSADLSAIAENKRSRCQPNIAIDWRQAEEHTSNYKHDELLSRGSIHFRACISSH